MAVKRISALTAIAAATLAGGDEFAVDDASDTSETKKVSWTNLLANLDTAGYYKSGGTDVAVADGGTGSSTAGGARTNLGLAIGSDVQAHSAALDAVSGTNTGDEAAASATVAGVIEIATDAEATTGTDTARAVTAANVKQLTLDHFAVPTANVDFADQSLLQVGAVEEEVNVVAAAGATEALDVSAHGVHDVTMDENCTLSFTNPAPSGEASSFTLVLRGAFTPTFPASVDWPDGTAPTYSTPTVFVFTTVDGGTTWLGFSPGKAIA